MAKNTTTYSGDERSRRAVRRLGRRLMLVPEGLLIVALLIGFCLVGGSPLLAVLIASLTIWFLTRMAALHMGRMALEVGRYREAASLQQLATWLYPWSADALALRGTLALATGDAAGADAALRRAVELLPDQPEHYVAWSSALLELGRPVEAAGCARRALALDSRNPLIHLALAEAEGASGAPALQVEERLRAGLAVADSPDTAAALQCALAAQLFAQGRTAEAMLAAHSSEALLPRCAPTRQAELRFYLGDLLTTNGQTDRAREHFRNAEELGPQGRHAAAVWRGARL